MYIFIKWGINNILKRLIFFNNINLIHIPFYSVPASHLFLIEIFFLSPKKN